MFNTTRSMWCYSKERQVCKRSSFLDVAWAPGKELGPQNSAVVGFASLYQFSQSYQSHFPSWWICIYGHGCRPNLTSWLDLPQIRNWFAGWGTSTDVCLNYSTEIKWQDLTLHNCVCLTHVCPAVPIVFFMRCYSNLRNQLHQASCFVLVWYCSSVNSSGCTK